MPLVLGGGRASKAGTTSETREGGACCQDRVGWGGGATRGGENPLGQGGGGEGGGGEGGGGGENQF